MCCLVYVGNVWQIGMSEFNVENVSSAAGNYIFAAVKGTESYPLYHVIIQC